MFKHMNQGVALPLTAVWIAACGASQPAYSFRGESTAAGADAELHVETRAPNAQVRLEIGHLVPPGRVGAGAEHYAVWIQPQDQDPIHVANLDYNAQRRKGEAMIVTPHQQFDLLVTAEETPLPESPSDRNVLSQQVVLSDQHPR